MKKYATLAIAILLLSAAALAQHSNVVNWVWTQGTGGAATGFILERGSTSGGPYTVLCGGTGQPACPSLSTLTYTDTSGLVDGQVSFYVVVATGPGGNAPNSPELKLVTPFLPPNAASSLSGTAK